MKGKRGWRSSAELAPVRLVVPAPEPVALPRLPAPPEHLSPAAKAWWHAVVQNYDLAAHHQHLLRLACEALDRGAQARKAIEYEGTTFEDEKGILRARPEVMIELNSRTSFARLLRELDLDATLPSAALRPPPLRSNR